MIFYLCVVNKKERKEKKKTLLLTYAYHIFMYNITTMPLFYFFNLYMNDDGESQV